MAKWLRKRLAHRSKGGVVEFLERKRTMFMSDQEQAKILLEARDKGYSWKNPGQLLQASHRKILACVVVTLAGSAALKLWMFFFLYLTFFAGVALCYIVSMNAHFKTWPFSKRIIDWEKVERAAAGEAID
ncbi:MAG: hypothetical protein JST35_05095 [Armatimonadetes bacterium]|nr:hypothetical protein [Armatimonadota bacterium]